MPWKAFTYWFNKIISKACNLPLNITDKNKSEFKMMITEINLWNTDIKRKKKQPCWLQHMNIKTGNQTVYYFWLIGYIQVRTVVNLTNIANHQGTLHQSGQSRDKAFLTL